MTKAIMVLLVFIAACSTIDEANSPTLYENGTVNRSR